MKKAAIYTLGCRVNQYESEYFAKLLENSGFEISFDIGNNCDVCIINTCTVTGASDRKSRQIIRRAIRENPNASVIVTGCLAQISPDEISKISGVDAIIGNADKTSAVKKAILLAGSKNRTAENCVKTLEGAEFENMTLNRSERTRAYIKIEDGCENNCSYCIIPKARGKIRSKLPEDILLEAQTLRQAGYREIVLTGIEVAGYGKDLKEAGGMQLEDIVCMIDKKVGFERISFGSLEPSFLRPRFIDKISSLGGISHHFHLSLQSGCDKTLMAMRRKYNTEIVRRNIEHIRSLIPDSMFTADIIVGFPGESDEDFNDTVEFVSSLGLLNAHIFAYSKRPGTQAAARKDQISKEVKNERSAKLMAIVRESRIKILSEYEQKKGSYPVLFEEGKNGLAIGRLSNYIEVAVKSEQNLAGSIRRVKIVSSDADKLIGELED